MEGHAVIAPDVLATYAADAARQVPGVHGLVASTLHRHDGVKVSREDGRLAIELHLSLVWGAGAAAVGAEVQSSVADCLVRMADLRPRTIDVVVDGWHSA